MSRSSLDPGDVLPPLKRDRPDSGQVVRESALPPRIVPSVSRRRHWARMHFGWLGDSRRL